MAHPSVSRISGYGTGEEQQQADPMLPTLSQVYRCFNALSLAHLANPVSAGRRVEALQMNGACQQSRIRDGITVSSVCTGVERAKCAGDGSHLVHSVHQPDLDLQRRE